MGWRALGGTLGCHGLGGRWVPSGAGGPFGLEGTGGTLGCQDPVGSGGHWEDLGVHPWVPGTPLGWVGIGHLWVLGVPMGGWALGSPWQGLGCTFGCQGLTWGGWALGSCGVGGHWGAPLGAGDPMGWVGVGFLWVPLGWRALGCTLGCQDPIGSGGRWVPLGAGSLWVRGIGGAPLGATGWVGVGSLWFGWHGGAPLGAKTPLVWVGVGFPQVLGVSLGWRALGGTLGCWGPRWTG